MEGLDGTLVDIYNLLLVTIPLIQCGRNVPCNFWGWDRHNYFGKTGVRRGSSMVQLDKALVISYRLLVVTTQINLTAIHNSSILRVQRVHKLRGIGITVSQDSCPEILFSGILPERCSI